MVRRRLLMLLLLAAGAPIGPVAAQQAVALQMVEPIQIGEPASPLPAEVRVLGEREIAALAAAQSWPAGILDQQADHLAAQAAGLRFRDSDRGKLTQAFLQGQAARQRGDAVAAALKGHYALVMLDEQAVVLEAALQTATTLHAQIQRSIEIGLVPPTDESLWQAESALADIKDQQIQVRGRSSELRQQMALRLQAPWLCNYRPGDELHPALPSGDCEQWCREALAHRADYQAWLQIRCLLDAATLPEAQQLIAQLIPAWTVGAPIQNTWLRMLPFRWAVRRSGELGQLQSQLAQAVQGLASQICGDVQTAAQQLQTALARAELAEQQLTQIDEQLQRVRQLAEIGQTQAAEEARWTLRRQQALGERLVRTGEAKQAELELQRLMGFWDQ